MINERKLENALKEILSKSYKDTDGEVVDGAQLIARHLFRRAIEGSTAAFQLIRDSVGERPPQLQKVELEKGVDPEVIAEVEDMVYQIEQEYEENEK